MTDGYRVSHNANLLRLQRFAVGIKTVDIMSYSNVSCICVVGSEASSIQSVSFSSYNNDEEWHQVT